MNNSHKRWYVDPQTELPTIRRDSNAHDYLSPEAVKRMVAGERQIAGNGGYADEDDDSPRCPTCGGPAGLCEDD